VEVVGVVKDVELATPRAIGTPRMLTFYPYRDKEAPTRLVVMCAVVRTLGDPLRLAARVREELHALEPSLAVLNIDTVDQQLDDVLAQERLVAGLAACFAAAVVFLCCLGLYGLAAHMVARRTSEIGMRLALGATRRSVLRLVLSQGLWLVAAGVVIGVPASLAASRIIAPQLFGLSAFDPLTLLIAGLIMIAVAAIAGFLPARRASRVDPMVALRCE